MDIATIRTSLQSIPTIGSQPKDQLDQYKQLLQSILSTKNSELIQQGIQVFVEAIVNENVSLVISR